MAANSSKGPAAQMATVKVLLAGDCGGNFAALFNRVASVNKKNGPFKLLLCVGDFFGPGDANAPIPEELAPYIDGSKEVPVKTYFLGARGLGAATSLAALTSSSAELHWLGRCGLRELEGLNVAYLDGPFDRSTFFADPVDQAPCCTSVTEQDAVLLRQQLRDGGGEVDLLLTREWPARVTEELPPGLVEAAGIPPSVGAGIIAELALLARPRYHVCAAQGLFWQRPPYTNPDQGAGPRVTRFIALGRVGGSSSAATTTPSAPKLLPAAAGLPPPPAGAPKPAAAPAKFLHALGLIPAGEMTVEALSAVPEGALACPFETRKRPAQTRGAAEEEEAGGFNRWATGKRQRPRAPATPFTPWGDPTLPKDASKTVYIKNLSFEASYEEVAQFFSAAGRVVNIRRGATPEGRPQGWAHVQFDEEGAVAEACRLHGSKLLGRELFIDAANSGSGRPQQQQAAGRGGGGGDGEAVQGCWFCLSSPDVDTNLVVSVAEECYVALDKGQINPNHVQLVPIEHYPSLVAAPAGCFQELTRYLSALRACYAAQGAALVGFERHLRLRHQGGNHCHLQAVSISRAAGERAEGAFRAAMEGVASGEAVAIPAAAGQLDREALSAAVGDREYFLALLPDGAGLVYALQQGDRWPMQLGRQVLCDLAEAPAKIDWHNCTATPEQEAAAAEAFKQRFKTYDIMQE